MYLIQILLPLAGNDGRPLPQAIHEQVKRELTGQFKGLTAYSRSPAEGLWKPRKNLRRDDIVVYEVMSSALGKTWWRKYRKHLEKLFHQQTVIIRAQQTSVL